MEIYTMTMSYSKFQLNTKHIASSITYLVVYYRVNRKAKQ